MSLIRTQQDYIAARSQNWLPSYSIITMDAKDTFSIDTYQVLEDGKRGASIDDTFTIQKTETASETSETTETAETSETVSK